MRNQAKRRLKSIMKHAIEEDANFYLSAIECVVRHGRCSISMLQYNLGIGHERAKRLVERMEKDGIVKQSRSSRPRKVLMTLADYHAVKALTDIATDEESQFKFDEEAMNILINSDDEEQSDSSIQSLTPDQQEVMDALRVHSPVTIADLKCRCRKIRRMTTMHLGTVLNELVHLGEIERHFAEAVYALPGQEPQERKICPFVPAYDVMAILNKQLELLGRIAEMLAINGKR